MTFRLAVESTPSVAAFYRPGLQALSKHDAQRIHCANSRRLTGSVNVDNALRETQPHAKRWDYGIGLRRGNGEVAVRVEVHPASSTSIAVMLDKLRWLKNWLQTQAPALHKLTQDDFYWLSTGAPIAITANSKHAKRLASVGLRGPLRVLALK